MCGVFIIDMPSERQLERLKELYWELSYRELADELDCSTSSIGRWVDDLGLPQKTQWNRIQYTHGVSVDRVLYHLHYDALMATTDMSEALDISRPTLTEYFERAGVEKRSQSEAEKVKNQKMSDEERREQTEAARERQREKYGDGGYLEVLWDEEPEQMQEHVESIAELGTPARETNGMEGVTGQEHHLWSGGKNIYDAVKRLLSQGDESWDAIRERVRERQNYECAMCGERMVERGLDVHHSVPIMAGGTNADELLIGLCPSCHITAERSLERYPEFSPVLVEEAL